MNKCKHNFKFGEEWDCHNECIKCEIERECQEESKKIHRKNIEENKVKLREEINEQIKNLTLGELVVINMEISNIITGKLDNDKERNKYLKKISKDMNKDLRK